MILFKNVTKRFGRFTAIHKLDFEVPAQEALALWGPNGAGKTTVIKCLLGLLRYDGQILVNGHDARREGRAVRRLVGYVPQELSFYDDMSALETAQFFARLKKSPVAQAMAVLAQVELEEHAHKPVSALSGGMKQRLALGLALLADPPVLVLDEPTSNLDAGARERFLQLLAQVKAGGKTIIFTSHRAEDIEALGDQVLVMERGEIVLRCPARELADRLGLRSTVKLHLPPELMDSALQALHQDGFNARRNGAGLLVEVRPSEKAQPIHTLSRASITVTDFEME
jgi:ABC-type multidrug transport system ATPase subunit